MCTEHEEANLEKECASSPSGREDFNSEISSFCQGYLKNSINHQLNSKNLVTKNSTNDDYESLFNTITGNNPKEEDDCFEIKSGLCRLKNLKKQPLKELSVTFESCIADEGFSSKLEEVPNFKSEEGKFLQDCPRFSSEFAILGEDRTSGSKFDSKASEFGCTGKLEMR